MPPYDPKANRPKLVPVDDAAPVDAILGPDPAAPAAAPAATAATQAESAEARAHLTVVPPASPTPIAVVPESKGFPTRAVIAAGVTVLALAGAVWALQRRVG